MLTRSRAAAEKANKSASSEHSAASSRSSATVHARVLEAEAQHLRRIADLERAERESALAAERAERERALAAEHAKRERAERERALAAERAVAEAEHRARIASLEASIGSRVSSRHSSRRSNVVQVPGDGNESTVHSIPPQTYIETSQPIVPATVPCMAPEVVTQRVPLDVASSAMGRENTTQIRDHNSLNAPLNPATTNTFPSNFYNNFSAPINTFAPQHRTTFTTQCAPHIGATSTEIGTLRLAEEVAKIAAATATQPKSGLVSLPFFDGKPTDWLVFRRVYDTTNAAYSPAENLARISGALRGPARDAVAVLLAAACNPGEVMSALKVEFARPERIIIAELATVRALPRISHNETAREINAFACRVRHCIEVVRLLCVPEYLASPELANEIIGKFTNSLRSRWADFAYSREGEILELSDVANWRYVPTASNVADDATRINNNAKFDLSSRWFCGPTFLAEPHSQWPTEPSGHTSLGLSEMKQFSVLPDSHIVAAITTSSPTPLIADPTRFSRWLRLLRATARVIQCAYTFRALLGCSNSQNPKFSNAGSVSTSHILPLLSVEELERAERNLLLHSQIQSFQEEYTAVSKGSPPPKLKLRNYTSFIDNYGLMRLRGRISAVVDVVTDKNPVVLHGKHHITELLIHHYHEKLAHGGSNIVINELRQRYYVTGIRCAVKAIIRRCPLCVFRRKKPSSPPTGDLPTERLDHHIRPFTHTGLDYFGPVTVAIGRRTEKRYVALFTCLSVRAVHLEVVSSLSTDFAIMALRRFIARRGCPHTIFSDNGTAFVGANREFRNLYERPVQEFASNLRIRWKFIPPASPFMGGCWERLVRSVKVALAATMKERSPSEETLNTFLLEVESILN